jgi:hypothetical protein
MADVPAIRRTVFRGERSSTAMTDEADEARLDQPQSTQRTQRKFDVVLKPKHAIFYSRTEE